MITNELGPEKERVEAAREPIIQDAEVQCGHDRYRNDYGGINDRLLLGGPAYVLELTARIAKIVEETIHRKCGV